MLTLAQIAVSIILIILVLLQERESGLSGALGGGAAGTPYSTRRGLEKTIFWATLVFAALFALLAILNLII